MIISLTKLLHEVPTLKTLDFNDPIFTNWAEKFERFLLKVYGPDSSEFNSFKKITFWYEYTEYERQKGIVEESYYRDNYIKGIIQSELLLKDLLDEMDERPTTNISTPASSKVSKVFISHSSKDKNVVEEVIDLLKLIGINDDKMFCSSFEGYGIELGEDFLKRIKNELSGEVLVIFILTENYYASPICLCEMGATWVQTKDHIPIVVSPFSFNDIKGAIPNTQGLDITDKSKWNSLKLTLEKKLNLTPRNASLWENGRDKILKRIQQIIEQDD